MKDPPREWLSPSLQIKLCQAYVLDCALKNLTVGHAFRLRFFLQCD